jgi:hypothetical protein
MPGNSISSNFEQFRAISRGAVQTQGDTGPFVTLSFDLLVLGFSFPFFPFVFLFFFSLFSIFLLFLLLFHIISYYFILFCFGLSYCILLYFILFCVVLFCLILERCAREIVSHLISFRPE